MSGGVREEFAEAIGTHAFDSSDEQCIDGEWVYGLNCDCGEFVPDVEVNNHLADAVLSVVERVVAEARAEERASMQVAGYAAGTMRVVEVGQAQRALDAAREAGRAEVVAKVEALAAEWTTATCQTDGAPCSWHRIAAECAAEIRAALGRQAGGGE